MLTRDTTAPELIASLQRLQADQDATLLAATIMPDHAHLLFTLGDRISLGRTIAKFKTLARASGRAPWRWQDDSFEHRLRTQESPEDYAFYIFMNPYEAELIPFESQWPWWLCPDLARFRFLAGLNQDGTPPREWLREIKTVKARIVTS